MAYWQMKLHPNEPAKALEHTINSLCRKYIGLDFEHFYGDLAVATPEDIGHQRRYQVFATEMKEEDLVLIVVHRRPFALVEVVGPYNYLKTDPEKTLGVWFRHFRRIKFHGYYADCHVNPGGWPFIRTPGAISRIRRREYREIIDQWPKRVGEGNADG